MPTAQTARAVARARGARSPSSRRRTGCGGSDEPGAAVEALLARSCSRELNVDTDRVTITGFSNGGTGSLLYASRMPDRFAAVASLMGGGLPFFERREPDRPRRRSRGMPVPLRARRPRRADPVVGERAHGRRPCARRTPRRVAELHVLPRPAARRRLRRATTGSRFPFLERYARDPFPQPRLRCAAARSSTPRAFWVAGAREGRRHRGGRRLGRGRRRSRCARATSAGCACGCGASSSTSRCPCRVTLDGREAFAGPVAGGPGALPAQLARDRATRSSRTAAEIVLDVDSP